MVDRNARRQAAELLRHLVTGRISNDEFEDRFPVRCNDAAVSELRSEAWYLYDDLREYRLVGPDRLTFGARRKVAAWILFFTPSLTTSGRFDPRSNAVLITLANLCSFGLVGKSSRARFHRRGDIEVWPFIRRSDYERRIDYPPALETSGRGVMSRGHSLHRSRRRRSAWC